ncbi:MAG: hypothetical protein DMG97_18120 [Acidobacteria bacterium]|nr:MAG: hypothetical protein DMG97_18120 [Acidobacteriota bacterium]
MAVPSSPPTSSRPASNAACACSFCHRDLPSSTAGRARPADSHRGVLSGHGLLAGDEETQPRARQWERIYNTVRPHQSLGYLTPQQFLLRGSSQRKEVAGGCQRVWKNSGVTRANGFCLMCLACCSSDSTSNFSQKILRTRLTNATLTALLRFIAGKKLRSDVSSQPRKSRGWRSREGWVPVI